MSRALVLTAAAAILVSAVTKLGRRRRDSFGVRADNLKTAAKKVDNAAARVDVALKPLMAA